MAACSVVEAMPHHLSRRIDTFYIEPVLAHVQSHSILLVHPFLRFYSPPGPPTLSSRLPALLIQAVGLGYSTASAKRAGGHSPIRLVRLRAPRPPGKVPLPTLFLLQDTRAPLWRRQAARSAALRRCTRQRGSKPRLRHGEG